MTAVIQRINGGKVTVIPDDDEPYVSGECGGDGILVLLGVTHTDTEEDARLLADKIAKLRIFTDENDKMNLSLTDVNGSVIIVSNFTLYASYRKGNRPDYLDSAKPDIAKPLYDYFIERMKTLIPDVSTGVFGAHMVLSVNCDGPVTIKLDSEVLKMPKKGS